MGIGRIFAAGLVFAALSAAEATSITAMRSHDPRLARETVDRLVAAIDRNDMDRLDDMVALPTFHTEALGEVEYEEMEAFLAFMNSSDGREDAEPIRVAYFRALMKDKFYPVYLVTLERNVWKLKAYEEDGMLNSVEVDQPHWETDMTTWLVSFAGGEIAHFREADELFYVARRGKPVEDGE